MTAYFIIELDVADGPSLADYERQVTEHVVAAGGRFLVRGDDYVSVEGDWHPKRIVVVEFPDQDAILRYYHSHANQTLKHTRLAGTAGAPARAIAITGVTYENGSSAPTEAGVDGTGAVVWN